MRGHIRRRGKAGFWSIVLRDPTTGKVRWTATGTTDKREAERQLAKAITDLEASAGTDIARLTVEQWMHRWLEQKRTEVRIRSIERYEDGAAVVTRFLGPSLLRTLKPADVTRFMRAASAAGLSVWQVRFAFGVLRRALRYAVRQDVLVRDVTDACTPPRLAKTERRTLTPAQVHAVLTEATAHRLHAMWALAVTTGLRRGELLGLRWEDIDLDARTVTAKRILQRVRGAGGKGHKTGLQFGPPKTPMSRRTVVMPSATAEHLRRWQREQAQEASAVGSAYDASLVFPTGFGKPTDPRSLKSQFDRLLTRAQVPSCRLHDLRHTFASLMVAAGADQKALQQAMGHESIRTTLDLYAHLYSESQRAGADALGAFLEAEASKSASKAKTKGGEMAK